ncbi:MAG: hypothetical protein NTY00_10800 [Deltaproteobacteria bacterium]|nr:hypothetical protein [Deltaproteobacteria bacterium]
MRKNIDLHSTSDGWRGVIADSFTFEFVKQVSVALAHYLLRNQNGNCFIGYDTRFLSYEFAQTAYKTLACFGIKPLISPRPIPTPVVSYRTHQKELGCGVCITASHNPYCYNGIKVRLGYGGPPDSNFVEEIEELIKIPKDISTIADIEIDYDDPINDYLRKIKTLLDLSVFKLRPLSIVVDTMHGATTGILERLLAGTRCEIREINNDTDPYFGGVAPEPQKSNTKRLQEMVAGGPYRLGVAHDGDGDRIVAAIPERGYLSPHDISVALLWYLAKQRGERGTVVGSVTLSKRVSQLAQYLGLKYVETPIGFRNACQIMRKEHVLIAAEENGGIGFGSHLPERDGTIAAALLVEAELTYKNGVEGILTDISRIVGESGFCRKNLKLRTSPATIIHHIKQNPPDVLAKHKVVEVSHVDGVKFLLQSGDWVNLRAAGTEKLLRIYAEAGDNHCAIKLAAAAESIVRKIERGQSNE